MSGYSLHIGLDFVDPVTHGGWSGQLANCVRDARSMEETCFARGFDSRKVLLNKDATYDAVWGEITRLSFDSKPGDLVFISDSRHGGRVYDTSGDEASGYDTIIVLYDKDMLDDELGMLWGLFKPGVRVVYMSDSCHSDGAWRSLPQFLGGTAVRRMPREVSDRLPSEIHERTARLKSAPAVPMKASLIGLAACQEDQLSSDGPPGTNGAYTGALLKSLSEGPKNWRNMQMLAKKKLPSSQIPQFNAKSNHWSAFVHQKPFTVTPPA